MPIEIGMGMVTIQVDEKDVDKVFEILSSNGRFTGLPDNKFRIEENVDKTLETLKSAGIKYEVVDGK